MKVCPKPAAKIDDVSIDYIRLYRHYKNHIFPYDGGILSQPHKYLQAMEIIDGQVR